MSLARRRNVKNRLFDWQTEFLPVVQTPVTNVVPSTGGNSQVEGFSLANAPAQPTVRLNNQTQISERDATVSGSQEEADAAGKGSEMAHQMALASKVLKSDMEVTMCSRQARNDGNDSGPSPRQTECISHWIGRAKDKNNNAAAAVAGVTTGLPTLSTDAFATPGSPVQVTEVMLGNAMQAAYQNGASPTIWVLPPGPKRTVSTFVGRSTTQVLVGKTEVVSTVDVIATDFGRIKAVPSRWVPTDVALLLDPDYVAVAFYRAFRQYLMARVGDAETRMVVCEWGVEMRNPLSAVLFNGITP